MMDHWKNIIFGPKKHKKSKPWRHLMPTLSFCDFSNMLYSTYLMLLGPLCVVSPFLIFYFVKQKSPYFQGWTWLRFIGISFVSYALGLVLGTLCLYTLIVGDSLIISAILAGIILIDLIYSSIMFGLAIIRGSSFTVWWRFLPFNFYSSTG